jgi:hypothetical protein
MVVFQFPTGLWTAFFNSQTEADMTTQINKITYNIETRKEFFEEMKI